MRKHWNDVLGQLLAVRQRGAFSQDVTFLMGGKAITMVIGLVLTPILARIFDQEAFGLFGLLNSIATTGAAMLGLRLGEAFILPRGQGQFLSLFRVTWWSTLVMLFLFTVLLLLFATPLFALLQLDVPWYTRLVLPAFMLLYAVDELQVHWVRRLKAFRKVSIVDPLGQLSSRLFAIGMGLLSAIHWWLLIKEAFRVLVNMVLRWRMILRPHYLPAMLALPGRREGRAVLGRYWRLPAFRLPTALVGITVNALPAYFIAALYDARAVGDLTMANTLLTFPLFLFANTLDSVFQQKAAELRQRGPVDLMRGTLLLYTVLLFLGSLIFGVVYWHGDVLFSIFLGAKWEASGRMAMIMAPWFLARMITTPVVGLRLVLNKQLWDLSYAILTGVLIIAVFTLSYPTGRGVEHDLMWLSWCSALLLLISSIGALATAGIRPIVALVITLIMITLGAGLTWLPKLLF